MQTESKFIKQIHSRLGTGIHIEKMDGSRNCPDYYYEGNNGGLWVEYKVYPNTPSKLQQLWAARAWANEVPCWILTRLKDGVLLEHDNSGGNIHSLDEIANLIRKRVTKCK